MARSRKKAPTNGANGKVYVAYYRVSTARQGESGLGLEAQRIAVARFIDGAGQGATLAAEYTEIESGKSHHNRPQLQAAIGQSKKLGATLVIAKLDRLARNVHFISGLLESASDFVAVDLPSANKLTIHIMAAMAEQEREMISARTKAGLEAAQKEIADRGFRVSRRSGKQYSTHGNPRWQESIAKATAARKKTPATIDVRAIVSGYRVQGLSHRAIAHKMNELGIKTPTGASWYASSVQAVLCQAPEIISAPADKNNENRNLAA